MSGDFKREDRYIVVKRKRLTEQQEAPLLGILNANNIPTQECVVVEPDWPNYEHVWQTVEEVADGTFNPNEVSNLKSNNNKLARQNENLQDANIILKAELREANAQLSMIHEHQRNCDPAEREVWYWQGDGEDHPESMVNSLPVVIRAEDLKELISANNKEPSLEWAVKRCEALQIQGFDRVRLDVLQKTFENALTSFRG